MDWIAGLDWITGLTFELKLCVSHDLHPIIWAVNGSHVRCLAANRLPRNKGRGMQGVLCLRGLKGMRMLQQMEQLGRPIGTIIYSKASR